MSWQCKIKDKLRALSDGDALPELDVCGQAAWAPLQTLLAAQVGGKQLMGGVEKRSQ